VRGQNPFKPTQGNGWLIKFETLLVIPFCQKKFTFQSLSRPLTDYSLDFDQDMSVIDMLSINKLMSIQVGGQYFCKKKKKGTPLPSNSQTLLSKEGQHIHLFQFF
jgi:hypothetical protein